jgi:hypothetical protein
MAELEHNDAVNVLVLVDKHGQPDWDMDKTAVHEYWLQQSCK